MSRISGKFEATQPINEPITQGGTPGRAIAGEPTEFGPIPTTIEIIPDFAPTVRDLAPHQAEPPPVLTIGNPTIGPTPSTTTTTTTKRRMDRGLSMHRMRDRLANSEQTPRLKERSRSPSPMGQSAPLATRSDSESAGHSADEIPVPTPPVFRKVTLQPGGGQKSDSRLGERRPSQHRLPRQLARTGETPRPMRVEQSPPPMVSSAPDAPITRSDADPPAEWQKAWRKQVRTIMKSGWCMKALSMVDTKRATLPDLATALNTPRLMRAAHKHGLNATEAASIFLYTSALFKDINQALREENLSNLRPNRREALETMIRNIDSGLLKLPLVTDPLVRVVKLKESYGKKLKVGELWHAKAFESTVRISDQNMKWEGNYVLYLVGASGAHDVRDFSDAPKEREVLIERGHEYEVVSRDENGERVNLELREIAPTGKQT